MTEGATQLETANIPEEGAKLRLLTMDSLDGRTTCVKKLKEFETQITADLGDDLTEAQRSIMRRAAVLSALLDDQEARWAIGEPFVLTEYCAAVNVLNRLLSNIGLERKQKPVNEAPLLLG